MNPDLKKYIESLPVHTFLLAGDILVIGRLVQSDVAAVHVSALCSIETVHDEKSVQQRLLPLVPLSIDQISTIYRPHIVLQTPAGFALKKSYCDTLLKTKINEFEGLYESYSNDLETKKDNPFKDRWNIN